MKQFNFTSFYLTVHALTALSRMQKGVLFFEWEPQLSTFHNQNFKNALLRLNETCINSKEMCIICTAYTVNGLHKRLHKKSIKKTLHTISTLRYVRAYHRISKDIYTNIFLFKKPFTCIFHSFVYLSFSLLSHFSIRNRIFETSKQHAPYSTSTHTHTLTGIHSFLGLSHTLLCRFQFSFAERLFALGTFAIFTPSFQYPNSVFHFIFLCQSFISRLNNVLANSRILFN